MPLPTLADIEAAAQVVYRDFAATPQYRWALLSERLGTDCWLKHENHTPVGAFKIRGGLTYFDQLARRGALRRDYETGSNAALGCLVAEVTEIAAAGAAAVVLGCGAMSGLAGAVRERVPAAVIEPLAAALDQSVLLACATG